MVDAALTTEALLICHSSGPRFFGTFGWSMISLAKIGISHLGVSVLAFFIGGSFPICVDCFIKREDLSPLTAESTSKYIFGWLAWVKVAAAVNLTFI